MAPIDDVCKMGKFELVPSSADITMLNEIIIYEWPHGWDAGARWLSVGGGRMNSSSGAAAFLPGTARVRSRDGRPGQSETREGEPPLEPQLYECPTDEKILNLTQQSDATNEIPNFYRTQILLMDHYLRHLPHTW